MIVFGGRADVGVGQMSDHTNNILVTSKGRKNRLAWRKRVLIEINSTLYSSMYSLIHFFTYFSCTVGMELCIDVSTVVEPERFGKF